MRLRPLRSVFLAVLPALLLALAAPSAGAAFPGRDGLVVYAWHDELRATLEPNALIYDAQEIRASRPGGMPAMLRGCIRQPGRADVGDCSISYASPAVSPDGRRIAFDAGAALALMRSDGGSFRLLRAHSADDGSPAFSPDGRRLAFTVPARTQSRVEPRDLWIADLAGAHARRLVAGATAPAWSVRGWIAFLRGGDVYRVRPNGRGLRRLVARRRCTDVAWSPHGTRLVLACRGRVVIADGDGRHLRRVPLGTTSATEVAWSPSGARIAFSLEEGTLGTTRLDGSHGAGIESGGYSSQGTVGAAGPDWQPLPRR
jgi:WD40 repeat protein